MEAAVGADSRGQGLTLELVIPWLLPSARPCRCTWRPRPCMKRWGVLPWLAGLLVLRNISQQPTAANLKGSFVHFVERMHPSTLPRNLSKDCHRFGWAVADSNFGECRLHVQPPLVANMRFQRSLQPPAGIMQIWGVQLAGEPTQPPTEYPTPRWAAPMHCTRWCRRVYICAVACQ